METVIKCLADEQVPVYKIAIDEKEYSFSIVNNDKVVFFLELKALDDINHFVNMLPSFKSNLKEFMKDMLKNIEKPEGVLIDIPSFLWDLYVVGFRKIQKGTRFDELEIDKIQKDQFVARKVVIEYQNNVDFKDKLIREIFPERRLNNIVKDFKGVDTIKIEDLLINVKADPEEKGFENFSDVNVYLQKINFFIDSL